MENIGEEKLVTYHTNKENGAMKLKISLHNYCRLCAIGNAQLLHCEAVLFDDESSKTTLRDLVQMYMPAILKDDEGILLPKKICIACVKAMLNWGDFIHRSLNSHNYFMKLLSREFEVPADNAEIVTFIRETKNYFSGSLVRYFSRLTPESRVHFEKKSTPLNKNEAIEDKSKKVLLMKDAVQKYTSSDEIKEADIYQPNNEFEKSAVDTPSLGKRHSVDSSTLPSIFKRKVCRARARKRRRISSPSEKRGRALLQQKYLCQNQSSLSYSTGHPEPFLVSLNSSLPEKLFCTPSVTLYQEIVSNSDPYVPGSIKESEDDCRMLDVDNLVDGSTAWVYRLKKSELAYVLNSYGKNAQGSCITLQKRLINHLKQRINVNEHQPLDNEESNNEERENYSETEVEAIEVPPNPNTDVVAQDHCYSKEAPPGYFRLEDELFKPRSSGPINMQFFVGMSSNLTENLISKMSASELSCILEICNIEREGSGAIRNKLIKYLNYIKATPSARPEASKTTNEDAERIVTDASSAVSSGGNRYSSNFDTSENPSDQSNDTPFKGFQSTHEASGNHSDQSGDSPFKGFQSDSYQNHTLEPKLTVSYGNPLDSCSEIDHVASNIKTEVPDTPNFDYNIYQNSELNIKEEPLDEYLESPDSTRLDNFNSYCAPTDSQLLCLNREIHSELIKYFKTYGVGENVDKYKCCVALEKLHPAIISFYCSPFTGYSSSLCSSPTSSTTITCPSPNLSPCSSSFDAESPPKKQMVDEQLIKVKKFEDLC